MQVSSAILACLPAGRALSSVLLAASQHVAAAATVPSQLWQQAHTSAQYLPPCSTSSSLRHFSSSSHQPSSDKQDGPSSSSSQQSQQDSGRPHLQQEAQQAAKGMLAKNFDMEELWFAAVGGKLKVWSARTHPDLKGREEEVVGTVQQAYYDTLQRASTGHLLSTRSRSQMKQACLAAATYKVLVESVPGTEAAAEQFIADLMGGLYAPFMLGGLKVSSWMKRLLLRQSSISQAVDTLHTIARDMEGACHCSVQPLSCGSDSEADDADDAASQQPAAAAPAASADNTAASTSTSTSAAQQEQQQQPKTAEEEEHEKEDEAEATAAAEAAAQHHTQKEWQLGAALTVDSCLYAEVLKSEGMPQLLKSFCCQHNMSWLQTYSSQGVASHLEACIAKGDGCCRITVTPTEKS